MEIVFYHQHPCVECINILSPSHIVVSSILHNILSRLLPFAKLDLMVFNDSMYFVLLVNCLKLVMKEANNGINL